MAKEQSAEVKLKYAAATVHTYESFGRAIVAAALAQAAKRAASGKQSAMTATVSVAPIEGRGATYFHPGKSGAGDAAAGQGAGGPAAEPPAVSLTICFGDDCYTVST